MLRLSISILGIVILAVTARVTEKDENVPLPHVSGTPTPAACQVAPRSLQELRDLIGTPSPNIKQDAVAVPIALPTGQPADAKTVSAVTAAVVVLVACDNAGEGPRLLALYSDAFLRRIGPLEDLFFDELATPAVPLPTERQATLLGVDAVELLSDGRVTAVVREGNREDEHPSPGRTFMFIFVREDGRFLLDDVLFEIAAGDDLVNVADLVDTPTP